MFIKIQENPKKFKQNLTCNCSAHRSQNPDRKDLQLPAFSTAQGAHPAELFSHTINTKQAQLPQANLYKNKAEVNIDTAKISPFSQQKKPKVKVRPKLLPITTTKPSYKPRQEKE